LEDAVLEKINLQWSSEGPMNLDPL